MKRAIVFMQVEGGFVFGIGFVLTEDVERDAKGKLLSDGTWTYKPPTMDTIPQKFNVELYNSPEHKDRILSSKGSAPRLATSFPKISNLVCANPWPDQSLSSYISTGSHLININRVNIYILLELLFYCFTISGCLLH